VIEGLALGLIGNRVKRFGQGSRHVMDRGDDFLRGQTRFGREPVPLPTADLLLQEMLDTDLGGELQLARIEVIDQRGCSSLSKRSAVFGWAPAKLNWPVSRALRQADWSWRRRAKRSTKSVEDSHATEPRSISVSSDTRSDVTN
jgi:hypothetical protein